MCQAKTQALPPAPDGPLLSALCAEEVFFVLGSVVCRRSACMKVDFVFSEIITGLYISLELVYSVDSRHT